MTKIVDDKRTESQFMVLLEEISSNVKLLAEGQGAIVNRMDHFEDGQTTLINRTDSLEQKVDTGFKTIMDYLMKIEDELVEIHADIAYLKEHHIEPVRVKKLEKRVGRIEEIIHTLKVARA